MQAAVELVGDRPVVVARSVSGQHRGALSRADGATFASAARLALAQRLPLVLVVATSGSDVNDGISALHGWGEAAAAVAACSGTVPVLAAVTGPAVSGPALVLGVADVTAMTPEAFAFVSGPAMVEGFTGVRVGLRDLGGAAVHATSTGLCALSATDPDHALELLGATLNYLPDHADAEPPVLPTDDEADRTTPELREVIPASATASYDVRDVIRSVADEGELLELRPGWAPQLVTALSSVARAPVGVIANQPRALAGTLDILASQKGARQCDSATPSTCPSSPWWTRLGSSRARTSSGGA
jgi:acetyl-CoA carboxylase carboxyltransferase component